jgi:predicted enzyme related to lactoylglutathione lyase
MVLGPIIEVIVYVEDMQKQVSFYSETLGLKVSYPHQFPERWTDCHWVTFETGQCTLALHSGGLRNFGKDAPKFVFQVENVEQIREELVSKGVDVKEIFSPSLGVRVANGRDPEGNVFSLEQHERA